MVKRGPVFLVAIFLIGVVGLFSVGNWYLAPVGGGNSLEQTISFTTDTDLMLVSQKLKQEGFIRSETVFNLVGEFRTKERIIPAGGYKVSKAMGVFELIDAIYRGPQLKWITIPPTLRKEEIAEKLAVSFEWGEEDAKGFLSAYQKVPGATAEGMYFPDTYLIPIDESGEQVGMRMIYHFNDQVAPLVPKFAAANIKLDTALKIASLVQKEAGATDKKLVAGIIWNRLLKGMPLQIDATVQYAKGKVGNTWWSRVSRDDYKFDSPFNTYKIPALPPTPIANPSLAAIEAVLNPDQTDCLFYLHDPYRDIYCSPTYEGHLKNIDKYLK